MSTAARNQKLAFTCGAIALGMLGMAYAAVPLYQLFCQVTGYAGTTQRAEAPSGKVLKRTITVRFDANTDKRLPWTFEPVKASMTVRIGEQNLAFYRATNTSDKPVTGTASFNVAPAIAGSHFAKIACFCFTEQTLKPGQSVDMPVSFYVDPGLVEDADARGVQEITLSYTFFPVDAPKRTAEKRAGG